MCVHLQQTAGLAEIGIWLWNLPMFRNLRNINVSWVLRSNLIASSHPLISACTIFSFVHSDQEQRIIDFQSSKTNTDVRFSSMPILKISVLRKIAHQILLVRDYHVISQPWNECNFCLARTLFQSVTNLFWSRWTQLLKFLNEFQTVEPNF